MRSYFKLPVIIFMSLLLITSCSEKDSLPVCGETELTIIVNGETQVFDPMSRGIILLDKGYELTVGFHRQVDSDAQNILITLPYKRTGKNVIEKFWYSQYVNGVAFEGDYIEGDFQSEVTTNNRFCFSVTFNGNLSDGNQEIVISSVQVNYQYMDPFDN